MVSITVEERVSGVDRETEVSVAKMVVEVLGSSAEDCAVMSAGARRRRVGRREKRIVFVCVDKSECVFMWEGWKD